MKLYSEVKSARNSKRININNMITFFIYDNFININNMIILLILIVW